MRSAWDLTPSEIKALGYGRDGAHLFGRFQRVSTWAPPIETQDETRAPSLAPNLAPNLARVGREFVTRHEIDFALPAITSTLESKSDGSTRLVLTLPRDGERVEAVHMPRPRASSSGRTTICLSTQVGCAMGCTFCATAKMGLRRNLEAHEIVGQLLAVMSSPRFGPRSAEHLNIVFMGMGEPLHNVDALIRTLDVICDSSGLGVAKSRITVSTAGHVAGLARLAASASFLPELAVSVNAATDDLRRSLMPVNRKWPLADLRRALDVWPLRPHQKITLEYVLLKDTNDDEASAIRLATWIGDLRHVVNVIPFNAWSSDDSFASSPYREPSRERIDAFVATLRAHGCLVKVRYSRGRDVRAACGTLFSTWGSAPHPASAPMRSAHGNLLLAGSQKARS